MSILKEEELSDAFEIKNGIFGVNRDIIFQLVELIRVDDSIRNLIGINGECTLWLNHPHYPIYRYPRTNLKKQTNSNIELEKNKLVEVNTTTIMFKTKAYGSVFLKILVKEFILECTIEIKLTKNARIYIGISSLSGLNNATKNFVGFNSGASLCLDPNFSCIICNGKWSCHFKEGGITNGENIKAIIDHKRNNISKSGGKMNFIRFEKTIPHTITNIPSSGVFLGFSSGYFSTSFALHITSLRRLRAPSPLPMDELLNKISLLLKVNMLKYIAYDFNGWFENINLQDEEGNEIVDMENYYTTK